MANKVTDIFGKFPKVFWIAQTFEMMERGAYYSMMPILVIHAIYNVGLNPYLGGMIAAFMYPLQYGLPIFSGALAEKVGYKKQIIFAFSFLTIAYFFLFFAFNTITMILAVMAVGVGIGSYKPLISATVAKCTTSKDRNLAYSIYYWVVNLAAFLFPLCFVFAELAGYLPRSAYSYVFFIGGIMVSVNIITAIFIFEEVPRSGKVKTVADAVNNIKLAFKDKKFVVMVILIGGFWALYSTMLFAIQIIGYGYRWFPLFFTAMVLGIPNPMTIILLGPFISKFIEKIESMRVVLAGLVIYLVGLIVLGYSLQNWQLIIVGIIIASIGEFLVAPGYLAFISKLAPKDNISAYIGCNFISYMIGLLGGTIAFSFVVNYIGVDLRMPYFFYGILISFGLFLLFAFIMYYRTWGQDIIERANKIRALEEGISEETDSDYVEPFMFRIFDKKPVAIIPLVLIPIILFTTFSFGTFNYIGPEEDEVVIPKFDLANFDTIEGISEDFGGNIPEGGTNSDRIKIELDKGEFLSSITFELIWQDEPDSSDPRANYENQPDQFRLDVAYGDNASDTATAYNSQGGTGTISLTFEFSHRLLNSTNGIGDYSYDITLVSCGNQQPQFSIIGIRDIVDNSNDFDMFITTEKYVPKNQE